MHAIRLPLGIVEVILLGETRNNDVLLFFVSELKKQKKVDVIIQCLFVYDSRAIKTRG